MYNGKFSKYALKAKQRKDFAMKKDNGLSGNGMIPHDLWRRIIPIALEYEKGLADMAKLYSYLIANVNGETGNDRYMSAFPDVDTVVKEAYIGKNRVAALSDALEAVGLLETTYDYAGNKRKKLYYPQYYSTLTDDEIRNNLAEWKRKQDDKKR